MTNTIAEFNSAAISTLMQQVRPQLDNALNQIDNEVARAGLERATTEVLSALLLPPSDLAVSTSVGTGAVPQRVFNFNGMDRAQAFRLVKRLDARRSLVESLGSGLPTAPAAQAQPIAAAVPTPKPEQVPVPGDAQMAGVGPSTPPTSDLPGQEIDPGIIAPGDPGLRTPAGPGQEYTVYRTGPDPGSTLPGTGGAGPVPNAGGGTGQGGASGGGQSGSAPKQQPGTTTPAPQMRYIENPPGRHLVWNNDDPIWDDGTPVHIWRDEQGRVHYGYPVPIPGSEDDAYPIPTPGSGRSVPEQGTQPEPSPGNAAHTNPGAARDEQSPAPQPQAGPGGPSDDATTSTPASGTEPGIDSGVSPLDPPPGGPLLRVPPPPEPVEEPELQKAEPEDPSALEELLRWLGEYISSDPSLLESFIPVYGALRQAIADGLRGNWGGFALNMGFLILDLTGIGFLGRKVGQPVARFLGRLVDSFGNAAAEAYAAANRTKRQLAERLRQIFDGTSTRPQPRVPGGGEDYVAPFGKGPFSNKMKNELESELADADAAGIFPITPAADSFDDLINTGERIKWAVTLDGELLVIPHDVPGFGEVPHSVLVREGKVMAAGEASIGGDKGMGYFGLEITPHSGHFQPSLESMDVGREAFARYGIIFP
ncbi:hypothetical protein [Nocardia sp. NPDC048505]|uniref:hypothetical protein n=1 Tax=unclassified Nocardia TaxID=2637762 RepID=UPI0033C824F0